MYDYIHSRIHKDIDISDLYVLLLLVGGRQHVSYLLLTERHHTSPVIALFCHLGLNAHLRRHSRAESGSAVLCIIQRDTNVAS